MPNPARDAWMHPHPSITRKQQKYTATNDRSKQSQAKRPGKSLLNPKPQPRPAPMAVEVPPLTASDRWFEKARREEIPLYFSLYHEDFVATIAKINKYDLHLHILSGPSDPPNPAELEVVQKLEIKYCCKASLREQMYEAMSIDSSIQSQSLHPMKTIKKRYRVPGGLLKNVRNNKADITATMRGGEVFKGRVEWYTRYEIKLILENGAKAMIMKHALLNIRLTNQEEEGTA